MRLLQKCYLRRFSRTSRVSEPVVGYRINTIETDNNTYDRTIMARRIQRDRLILLLRVEGCPTEAESVAGGIRRRWASKRWLININQHVNAAPLLCATFSALY